MVNRKSILLWLFGLLLLLAAVLITVGRVHAGSLGFSLATRSNTPLVRVLDEVTQQPIVGASISISDYPQWKTNSMSWHGMTDYDGNLFLPALNGRFFKTIDVSKNQYMSVSLIGIQGTQITVFLRPLKNQNTQVIASGYLQGWNDSTSSTTLQVGIVTKPLSASDLLFLQSESLISPLKDTIDVYGERQIPSNVVFPEQHLLGGISLNKTNFRLPLPHHSPVRLMGLQGQAELWDLVQSYGNYSLQSLNQVRFTRVGLSKVLDDQSGYKVHFSANVPLVTTHQVQFAPPLFESELVALATTDIDGDLQTLLVTDAKATTTSEEPISLVAPQTQIGKERDVLSFATGQKGNRISGALHRNAGRTVLSGPFLYAPDLSSVNQTPDVIRLSGLPNSIVALTFYDVHQPFWSIYVLPAVGLIDIPIKELWPTHQIPISATRKIVSNQFEFNQKFDEKSLDGKQVWMGLTRFTRSTGYLQQEIYGF